MSGLTLRYQLGPFGKKVARLAWSPDGNMFAAPCRDHRVRLYEGETGKLHRTLEGHTGAVLTVAWSPDGEALCSGGYDNVPRVWDVATGKQLHVLTGGEREVNSVEWSPDKRW